MTFFLSAVRRLPLPCCLVALFLALGLSASSGLPALAQAAPAQAAPAQAAPAQAAQGAAAQAADAAPAPSLTLERLPTVDLSALEPAVADQITTARRLFDESLAAGPENAAGLAEAYGGLGRIYHAYELVEPAAVCYRNAARLNPEDFRWFYYLAVITRLAGDLETAADHYAATVSREPGFVAGFVGFADVLRELGHSAEAEVILRRALETNPGETVLTARLGELALDQGRPEEAVQLLRQVLRRVPGANRLHYPLALAHRALGDLDKAKEHLDQRGEVGLKAEDELMDKVAEQRQGERVYILEGRRAYDVGRFVEAEAAFRRALNAAPQSVTVLVNLASAIGAQGRSGEALELYQQALDLDPKNRAAAYNVGVLAAGLGQLEQSEAAFRAVIEGDPRDLESIGYLARILEATNRREEALGVYNKARETLPDVEEVRFQQARLLVDLGRIGEALDHLESTYAEMPEPKARTSSRIVIALSRLLAANPFAQLRDGERALALAQDVFEVEPTADHVTAVALALAELGRCDEAASLQQQAIDAAVSGEATELAQLWNEDLQRYAAGAPCRAPTVEAP
ncbi:MAG: tetratricopeptide repeat protein [Acidobacteriota bacterium]